MCTSVETRNDLYWNPNRLLSYNVYLNMVLGGRGIGKTYGIKKWLIKRFLKTGEQFIYLRRYKSHLNADTVGKFFEKVMLDDDFKDVKFKVEGKTFKINGKEAGFAIPLSSWQARKGSEFPLVTTILYDEFLKEKDNSQYLHNEPQALLSMSESVFREKIIFGTQNVRIICLANSTTIANPFFIYFNLLPDVNKEFNRFPHNKEIIVSIPQMDAFKEEKRSSRFGELIKGTEYEDMSINNEFTHDSNDFMKSRTKQSKFKFAIKYDGFTIGVYIDTHLKEMYLSKNYDKTSNKIYALSKDDYSENNVLVTNYKEEYLLLRMVTAFKNGQLYFENQTIRTIAYTIFSKMGVK